MEPAHPALTDEERTLLIELLERERSELPAEIRHTRTPQMHDELRRRMDLVNQILDRLRLRQTA